jgi:hypothetical protein
MMKMRILLSLIFCALSSLAMADGAAGTTAPSNFSISAQATSSKNEQPAQLIHVTVRLLAGKNQVLSYGGTTLAGKPLPYSDSTTHTYVAGVSETNGTISYEKGIVKEGIFIVVTPTLNQAGGITAKLNVAQTQLLAMNSFKLANGLEIQAPNIDTRNLEQVVDLSSNQTLRIPLASNVDKDSGTSGPTSSPEQYTLEITVAKG